jgi:formylglycine-generating enzyme required for sulfatase activity
MAFIAGGSFLMGRNLSEAEMKVIKKVFPTERPLTEGEKAALTQEERTMAIFRYDYPAHEVKVAPFYLDKTEVSNRDYALFIKATGRASPRGWRDNSPPTGAEDNPVTEVSYRDAVEYCEWRGKQRPGGLSYRLPTEEEWEFAARGAEAGKPGQEQRWYPWGDQWRPGLANTVESRLEHTQIVTANPGGASPLSILNLSGNVAEWTATDFNHYPEGDRETPREKGYSGTYQVVRGGAYGYPKEWAMTTTRAWAKPTDKGPYIGFRCAADAKRQ